MDGSASIRPGPRAALIFTGHLRGSCTKPGGLDMLVRQAQLCQSAFARCDVFIHTWDVLEKNASFGRDFKFKRCMLHCHEQNLQAAQSSWPCVANLSRQLSPAAVTVETQGDRTDNLDEDSRRWTQYESLKNFRMNAAGMLGGVRLARRHSQAMGFEYAAAVRMRSDLGGMRKADFLEQFPNAQGWAVIRHVADFHRRSSAALPRGTSRRPNACLLSTCDGHRGPRFKRMDFCACTAADRIISRI